MFVYDYAETRPTQLIFGKFDGNVAHGPRKKRLDIVGNSEFRSRNVRVRVIGGGAGGGQRGAIAPPLADKEGANGIKFPHFADLVE